MSPFQSPTPPHEPNTLATTIIVVATTLGAAGLAALLKVWLENRRLLRKEYRIAMAERITELEKHFNTAMVEIGDLKEQNGRLEAEVSFLREEKERLEDQLASCLRIDSDEDDPNHAP